MAASNRVRYMAPLALLATIGAIYVLVHRELASKHVVVHSTTSHLAPGGRSPRSAPPKPAQFYVVKSGDTLSSIAQRSGLSLAELQVLNPGVDANALQTGQHIRISK